MSPERSMPGGQGVSGNGQPWYDYRPSANFSLRDELRLLDEALDEARARPRPPTQMNPPALAPVSHPALKHVSVHAAMAESEASAAVSRQQASVPEKPNGQPLSSEQTGGEGKRLPDDQEADGPRVTTHNLLNTGQEEVVVDRKRLLAAIICILQEELTRSK